jgi:hypothetical protein
MPDNKKSFFGCRGIEDFALCVTGKADAGDDIPSFYLAIGCMRGRHYLKHRVGLSRASRSNEWPSG